MQLLGRVGLSIEESAVYPVQHLLHAAVKLPMVRRRPLDLQTILRGVRWTWVEEGAKFRLQYTPYIIWGLSKLVCVFLTWEKYSTVGRIGHFVG